MPAHGPRDTEKSLRRQGKAGHGWLTADDGSSLSRLVIVRTPSPPLSPPRFHLTSHPNRANAPPLPSWDNAGNSSRAVTLAERVQRKAVARQEVMTSEFQKKMLLAECERLKAQKKCAAVVVDARKQNETAVSDARITLRELHERLAAADAKASRLEQEVRRLETELVALRSTNEEQGRVIGTSWSGPSVVSLGKSFRRASPTPDHLTSPHLTIIYLT